MGFLLLYREPSLCWLLHHHLHGHLLEVSAVSVYTSPISHSSHLDFCLLPTTVPTATVVHLRCGKRQTRRVDKFVNNRAGSSGSPQGLPDGVKPIDVAILILMVALDFAYSAGICSHKSPLFRTTCQFKIDQRRYVLVLTTFVGLMTSIYLFSAAFPTLCSIFRIRYNPTQAVSRTLPTCRSGRIA